MRNNRIARWALPALLVALLIATSDATTAKLCVIDPTTGQSLICSPF